MNARTAARHLAGYLTGISVFGAIIPYALYMLSSFHPIHLPAGNALRLAAAFLLGSIGIFFGLWSNAALFFVGEGGPTDGFNVAISPRTKHLVTTGPYRYTRNPMVFGAFSAYFALAIYWDSLQVIAVLTLFSIGVRFYLKSTEEKRLLRDFGEEYEDYRRKTSMILPLKKSHRLHGFH